MKVYNQYKNELPKFKDHLNHDQPQGVVKAVYKKNGVKGLFALASKAMPKSEQNLHIRNLVDACFKTLKKNESKIKKGMKHEVKTLKANFSNLKAKAAKIEQDKIAKAAAAKAVADAKAAADAKAIADAKAAADVKAAADAAAKAALNPIAALQANLQAGLQNGLAQIASLFNPNAADAAAANANAAALAANAAAANAQAAANAAGQQVVVPPVVVPAPVVVQQPVVVVAPAGANDDAKVKKMQKKIAQLNNTLGEGNVLPTKLRSQKPKLI